MGLRLKLVTHSGVVCDIDCDSVHITVADDEFGGSYGIRTGHAKAMFALAQGKLAAYVSGKPVLEADTGEGFATVENDLVTAVVNEIKNL